MVEALIREGLVEEILEYERDGARELENFLHLLKPAGEKQKSWIVVDYKDLTDEMEKEFIKGS